MISCSHLANSTTKGCQVKTSSLDLFTVNGMPTVKLIIKSLNVRVKTLFCNWSVLKLPWLVQASLEYFRSVCPPAWNAHLSANRHSLFSLVRMGK